MDRRQHPTTPTEQESLLSPTAKAGGNLSWIVRRFADAEQETYRPRGRRDEGTERQGVRFADAFRSALDDAPPVEPRESTRPRILLAETDGVSARALRHRLERDALDVAEYQDGYAALRAIETEKFDAALIDIRVAGVAGFEILRTVRASAGTDAALPIIILCWPGNDSALVRAFDMGANDVIERPYSLSEASARIRRLVRRADAK